jgi:hypothetical protein
LVDRKNRTGNCLSFQRQFPVRKKLPETGQNCRSAGKGGTIDPRKGAINDLEQTAENQEKTEGRPGKEEGKLPSMQGAVSAPEKIFKDWQSFQHCGNFLIAPN